MKHFVSRTALVLALGALSVSCDKIKPPQPQLKPDVQAPVESAAQQEQRTFMQAAQKELDDLRQIITGLKTKAQAAGAESKEKLLEETKQLEAGLSEAQQHLDTLKAATVESWNQMKETFKTSLEKVNGAVKSAVGSGS